MPPHFRRRPIEVVGSRVVFTVATVTWTDEWTFIATAAAAVVTFLALLVALLGPAVQQRWRRPEVTLAARGIQRVDGDPLPMHVKPSHDHPRRDAQCERSACGCADVTPAPMPYGHSRSVLLLRMTGGAGCNRKPSPKPFDTEGRPPAASSTPPPPTAGLLISALTIHAASGGRSPSLGKSRLGRGASRDRLPRSDQPAARRCALEVARTRSPAGPHPGSPRRRATPAVCISRPAWPAPQDGPSFGEVRTAVPRCEALGGESGRTLPTSASR
jgi:hypothetical protein